MIKETQVNQHKKGKQDGGNAVVCNCHSKWQVKQHI